MTSISREKTWCGIFQNLEIPASCCKHRLWARFLNSACCQSRELLHLQMRLNSRGYSLPFILEDINEEAVGFWTLPYILGENCGNLPQIFHKLGGGESRPLICYWIELSNQEKFYCSIVIPCSEFQKIYSSRKAVAQRILAVLPGEGLSSSDFWICAVLSMFPHRLSCSYLALKGAQPHECLLIFSQGVSHVLRRSSNPVMVHFSGDLEYPSLWLK